MMRLTQKIIEEKALEYLLIAEKKFQRTFKFPKIKIDLKGRCAGWCQFSDFVIRLNSEAVEKYPEKILERTLPHEIAHYIAREVFSERGHGFYWRSVCVKLGMVDTTRTHDMDLTPAIVRNNFLYKCDCREVPFSKRRHNNVVERGMKYKCNICGAPFQDEKGLNKC